MKKIVLFSDGTGNSAAKRHRTNVWRLYQALDVHRNDQIAFYDDGVGSQEFLPLKVLGGAFGWGLKRNVLELYKTLCRTYKNGDEIYLFGFSRGAFTVRMLAGMIACCGLYTAYQNEKDLRRTAHRNFAAYRSRYKRGLLSRPFRSLIHWLLHRRTNPKPPVCPEITFIGVWDTVGAYGLPVEGLAMLWDWLIYPLRFVDQDPAPKVKRACHALSIDDERQTFHPVLWSENGKTLCQIEQVWFAGAHADVGGGYPRHELALVTLDWMISKVEARVGRLGLHFIPGIQREYVSRSDWHGMQHDSRSGIGAYYRYKPREIEELCKKAGIRTPRIHRSVLERIKQNIVPYAPTALPESYKIVATRGGIPTFESASQAARRTKAMDRARDVIFWRHWLYAAFLVATAIFAVSPLCLPGSAGGACVNGACFADPLLRLMIYALPDFPAPWIEVLRRNPWWLATVLAVSSVLVGLKIVAFRTIQARAMAAWAELKDTNKPSVQKPLTTRLRIFLCRWLWSYIKGKGKPFGQKNQSMTTKLRNFLRRWPWSYIRYVPPAMLFLVIIVLLLSVISCVVVSLRATCGQLCHPTAAAELQDARTNYSGGSGALRP